MHHPSSLLRILGAARAAALIAFVAFGGPASAAVVLTQDDRSVSTTSGGSVTPGTPFEAWSVVGQQSSIAPTLMTGTGSGVVSSDVEFSERRSRFDVSFTLTAPTEVALAGTMTFDDFAFAGISFIAELNDGTSSLFSIPSDPFFWDDQGFGFASQTLAYNATLAPGSYQLILDVDPFGGNGQGTFDFTFTLVPEPGTALLLASGLVLLSARRRRA